MNAPVIPPKTAGSTKPDAEHEAIYRVFILEGLSGEQTAEHMNRAFPGSTYTRAAVGAYADRQGWSKGGVAGGHGRVPPPDTTINRTWPYPAGPLAAVLADLDPRDPESGKLLGRSQCRWPVGKQQPAGRMAAQLLCGEASHSDFCYCLTHYGKAYPGSKDHADAAKT